MKKALKLIVVNILTWESKLVLKKYKPKIIAVTGSVGKTSTKDAIYVALADKYFVRKSEKSFNSEIGLPLTILGCPNHWTNLFGWINNLFFGMALILFPHSYPKLLVVEVGADRPGDIKNIAKWLKPDVVVITRFAPVPVHVEFFGTPEKLIKEKSELVKALREEGLLVLSSDDDDVLSLKSLVRRKTVTFGIGNGADFMGTNAVIEYSKSGEVNRPIGLLFRIDAGGNSVPVSVNGSIGKQVLYSVLAAFAVGRHFDINMVDLSRSLSGYELPNGRMKLMDGIKQTVIIDDTYNSSPIAVREALETLKSIDARGKKIAVLGDMMELGHFSVAEHRSIGEMAVSCANILVTVGVRARDIAEAALDAGMDERKIIQFDEAAKAGKELETLIGAGDVILVKGSQAVRMERTVEEIMARPEDKQKLLVRQEKEWRKR